MSGTSPQIPPRPVALLTLFPSIIFPMFIGMIGETIVATALPAIAASLGRVELIAWVIVTYLISLSITAPVYGRLGDAFGRRRMMVVALSITIVGSILCAVSTSMEMLIAARTLQGLGGGGLITLSHALIAQSVPPRDRVRFHGYVSAIGFGASALGPVVGGYLTDRFGWPSVFLINVPLALVGVMLVFRLPARTTPFEPFRFDLPGLALFASFIWALLVLVEEVRQPLSIRVWFAIALTLVVLLSLVLLSRRERRASNPIFPPSLMKNPTVWRCNAMAVCHGAYFVSMLTFTPIYLRVVRDQSVVEIGLLMLPITFGSGIGSLLTGQIVSRIGRSAIFPSVGLSAFAVLLAILGLYAESMSTAVFAWYLGFAAIATGAVMGIVQVTVQAEVGATMLGTSIGLISLSRALGGATGTAMIGATLFATLAATGVEISTELQALLQGGSSDLAALGHADETEIRGEVAFAFHGVFLLIALYAAIGSALAWTLPRRTI